MNEQLREPRIVFLNTRLLCSDSSYQRKIDEKRVQKIVREFKPSLVNLIKVSFRNERYYIFDGQHRVDAETGIPEGQSRLLFSLCCVHVIRP